MSVTPLNRNRASMVKALRELAETAETGELLGIAMVAYAKGEEDDPTIFIGGKLAKLSTLGALDVLRMVLHESE